MGINLKTVEKSLSRKLAKYGKVDSEALVKRWKQVVHIVRERR